MCIGGEEKNEGKEHNYTFITTPQKAHSFFCMAASTTKPSSTAQFILSHPYTPPNTVVALKGGEPSDGYACERVERKGYEEQKICEKREGSEEREQEDIQSPAWVAA